MKKRMHLLALTLLLAMLLSLLSGCGGTTETETTADTGETTTAVSEEAETQATETETAEAESETPAAESAEAEQPAEETAQETAEAATLTLPLVAEETTYTMWATLHPAYMNYVTDLAELTVWKEIAARTNIAFDFTAVSGIAASDMFGLMIAGGDYTDVICEMDLFAEGVEAAIDQEIIQDLSGLLEENCSTYWDLVKSDDSAYLTLVTDSGYVGTLATLRGETGSTDLNGPILRADWLAAFVMEDPTTIEELGAYLSAANEAYGAVSEFSADGLDSLLLSCFNLSEFIVEDGTVVSMYGSPRFRNYLEQAAEWYAAGLIDQDFYSVQDMTENATKMANGQYALCSSAAQGFARILQYVTDPDSTIALHAINYVTTEVSDAIHVGQENALITDDDTWAISTSCQDPAPLLQLVEYMCTEEGQLLFNYGVEGETFYFDEAGEPQWTEFMTSNAEYAFDIQEYLYATATLPGIRDFKREMYAYSDEELRTAELFSTMDCSYNYPSYAVMTGSESEAYSAIESDLSTYAESTVLEFITGQTALTDETWETFQTTLETMGLSDMVAIKQEAYDRAQEKLASLS